MKYLKYLLVVALVVFAVLGLKDTVKIMKKRYFSNIYQNNIIGSVNFDNHKEFNKIAKIFVINLDRSEYRYNRINPILSNVFTIPHTRFSAIDGSKVNFTINSTSQKQTFKDALNNKIKFLDDITVSCSDDVNIEINKFSYLSIYKRRFPGEIGCYCSHRVLWKKVIDSGYDKVMILEDDIQFGNNVVNRIEHALREVGDKADILFLGFNYIYKSNISNSLSSNGFIKVEDEITSTEGYIITQKGARILYENSYYYRDPVDVLISNAIVSADISAYALWPRVVDQALQSDISKGIF